MADSTARMRSVVSLLIGFAATGFACAQAPDGTQAKPDGTAQSESAGSLQSTLVATSEAMLAAAQTQDATALIKVATPDLVVAHSVALAGRSALATCAQSVITLNDPQVRQTSPISAVLTYKMHQTCAATSQSSDRNATDNYVKQNGRWLVAVHTETPVLP